MKNNLLLKLMTQCAQDTIGSQRNRIGKHDDFRCYTPGDLPLCSPRKTNLNFLNGFPNSPEELIVDSYVWTEN